MSYVHCHSSSRIIPKSILSRPPVGFDTGWEPHLPLLLSTKAIKPNLSIVNIQICKNLWSHWLAVEGEFAGALCQYVIQCSFPHVVQGFYPRLLLRVSFLGSSLLHFWTRVFREGLHTWLINCGSISKLGMQVGFCFTMCPGVYLYSYLSNFIIWLQL